jgi:hypothetical protein
MHRLALLSLFLLATPCRAQEGLARYTAFVEIMGNAGVASLNADAAYGNGYGFRIGGFVDPTLLAACDDDVRCLDRERERIAAYLVVMGHRLVGERAHKLELGLGVLVGHAEPGVLEALPRAALTATLGYRLQPAAKQIGFRVGLAPIVAPGRVLLRPGFSVSYGLPTPR